MPRISVIIPVYNRQALTERALHSVRNQDVQDMEIIVVDDCSQPPFQLPETLAIKNSIRVIRHGENRGAGPARNSGIQAAHADWLAFLDSDDYWPANTLQPRLQLAEQNFRINHDPMVAYAGGFVYDDARTGARDTRVPRPSRDPRDFASGCWFCPGSTLLAHKAAFQLIGSFDPALRRLEDLDWFIRFALAGGRLEVWPDTAAIVEVGAKPQLRVLEDAATQLHAKYLESTGPVHLPPSMARRLESYLDVERAAGCASRRQWLAALYYLARSLIKVPRLTLHLERFWDTSRAPNP
jgi:glycosyltransferase involved in cell wall biosynthesis